MSKFNNLKKSIASAIVLSCAAIHFNAQVSTYTFSQSNSSFIPVSSSVTPLITATGTSGVASLYQITPIDVAIPFDFKFNDTVYRNCVVTSNGYITFGATTPATSSSTPISSTTGYDGAIAAFGKSMNSFANLGGTTGDIRTEVVGTAPNREFVIQWTNFRPSYSTSTTSAYAFSFQIRLKETTNAIDMVYDAGSYVLGSTVASGSVQVGLRGRTNDDFNNRLNSSSVAFINSTPGTANNSTQYTSTSSSAASGMPTTGLTYTWTPPTCYPPTLTTTSSTVNSITINWTSPSSSTGPFDVYYNNTGVNPTSTTTPIASNVAANTYTVNNLTPASAYYFWVRTNCGNGNYSPWTPIKASESTRCEPPALSLAGQTICPGTSATLTATSTPNATITWYDSLAATTPLATGSTYTTPSLNTTTNYYVTSANVGSDTYVGKNVPVATSGNSSYGDYGLNVNTFGPMIIKEVDVYPNHATNTSGTITIQLKSNVTNSVLESVTHNITIANGGVLNTIPLNFTVPAAGSYRLVVSAATNVSNLIREITSNMNYPYEIPGLCTIPSARFGTTAESTSYYYYLYNWKVASICESDRQVVTATVDNAACLSTAETKGKENIKIYPNPFTEIVNINKSELVKEVKILDLSGKLVRTINNPSSTLKLSDLQQGMYILALEMKDGTTQSSKIIKN